MRIPLAEHGVVAAGRAMNVRVGSGVPSGLAPTSRSCPQAILVWRAPERARDLLVVMTFLNALWAVPDAVRSPRFKLAAVDFYAKLLVNAPLAIRRADSPVCST